jgi:hypothetical protein
VLVGSAGAGGRVCHASRPTARRRDLPMRSHGIANDTVDAIDPAASAKTMTSTTAARTVAAGDAQTHQRVGRLIIVPTLPSVPVQRILQSQAKPAVRCSEHDSPTTRSSSEVNDPVGKSLVARVIPVRADPLPRLQRRRDTALPIVPPRREMPPTARRSRQLVPWSRRRVRRRC